MDSKILLSKLFDAITTGRTRFEKILPKLKIPKILQDAEEKTAQELLLEKVLHEQDSLDQSAHELLMKFELQKMNGKKGDKGGW